MEEEKKKKKKKKTDAQKNCNENITPPRFYGDFNIHLALPLDILKAVFCL